LSNISGKYHLIRIIKRQPPDSPIHITSRRKAKQNFHTLFSITENRKTICLLQGMFACALLLKQLPA